VGYEGASGQPHKANAHWRTGLSDIRPIRRLIYIILGVVLALSALLGIVSSSVALWSTVQQHGDSISLVVTIDRLLFVLMVVEILRTVRVSIQSAALVSEPFLVDFIRLAAIGYGIGHGAGEGQTAVIPVPSGVLAGDRSACIRQQSLLAWISTEPKLPNAHQRPYLFWSPL
jgi:hypothetical protein